jgi:predicted  nucleic acid-binding Zn-ribbon protein
LKAHKGKVTREEEKRDNNLDALKQLKIHIHDKEVALKATQSQVAKHKKQQDSASGKKEYNALQVELTQEETRCVQLEEEILNHLTETEERTGQIPELDRAVQAAHEEYARFEQEMQKRQASLTAQLAETQQQLQEAEKHIPERCLDSYQRVVSSHGPDGLAVIRNRTCSACYTEITAQNYNELLQERFILCKSCGRILYLPAE